MSIFRAAMDVGTNTCRLIIVEMANQHEITHERHSRVTRIGEGIGGRDFCISQAAMDRTLAVLREYHEIVKRYPVERVWLMGTQALREAGNGMDFIAAVREKAGLELEIISGDCEAQLSYSGAVQALSGESISGRRMDDPYVLDIGAGSTELYFCDHEPTGEIRVIGASAPIGCLRLLEKPMNASQIQEVLTSYWQREGDGKSVHDNKPLVAVGGTATTLGAIHIGMKQYDPEALLGIPIDITQVRSVMSLLESLSAEARLLIPGMYPGREDVMPWGLKILEEAMTYCRQESVVICSRDLLYGAIYAPSI